MIYPDLFGGTTVKPERSREQMGPYQRFKLDNHYHKADSKEVCCGRCVFHFARYWDRTYHKCVKMGASKSEATDIRVSYVCDLFEEERGA